MTFKIEFSDEHFRLVLVSPSGEEDYLEAVLYCSVSSVVGSDGRVYGCYLRASDPELDIAEQTVEANPDPDFVSTETSKVTVYDITDWPRMVAASTKVTMIPTEFDVEDEAGEGDEEEDGAIVDVEPIS